MGCQSSKPGLIDDVDGNGKEFLEQYSMDRLLGQGEFGLVKIVFSKTNDPTMTNPIACKILRKGMQFKDNTLYSAIKPVILRNECAILKTLEGKHHCLKLFGVYESPSTIYILTEYMSGGDMYEYLSQCYGATIVYVDDDEKNKDDNNNAKNTIDGAGLRTEDVSRMSFQLLDAVSHCAKHGVIHRDIKPENIMFQTTEKGAALKLIDFGSGTFCSTYTGENSKNVTNRPTTAVSNQTMPSDNVENKNDANTNNITNDSDNNNTPSIIQNAAGDQLHLHTTFAGSAFFISPEMFRKHYTVMTDVWSAGVTLYVLVAGYPADALQEAFNKLQSNKRSSPEDLKDLPHMPENMPDTFFEMLFSCLNYKHRLRKSSGEILETCEFVRFHKEHYAQIEDEGNEDGIANSNNDKQGATVNDIAGKSNVNNENDSGGVISLHQILSDAKRTKSILIEGSVSRHTAMLKYGQFERSVTSLLASVLVKKELKLLLDTIDETIESGAGVDVGCLPGGKSASAGMTQEKKTNRQRLQIIKIGELRAILNNLKFNYVELMSNIDDLSHGTDYNRFAYHVAFLRQFYTIVEQEENALQQQGRRDEMNELDTSTNRKWRTVMKKRGSKKKSLNTSTHTTESKLSKKEYGNIDNQEMQMASIHNGNAWDSIVKKMKMKQPRRQSF